MDTTHMDGILNIYQSGFKFDNIIISDNQSPFNPGFSLTQAHGLMTNCKAINNVSSTTSPWQNVESALYLFANGDVVIENCDFSNNISNGSSSNTIRTATVFDMEPSLKMINCQITNNVSNSDRNMYIIGKGNNEFINCTIANNSSTNYTIRACGDITLKNTIMYNDNLHEILAADESPWGFYYDINVDYSNVHNGQYGIINQDNVNTVNWGTGNLSADPEFTGDGDYPFALSEYSPCIDTGTPDTTGLFLPPWDFLHNHRVWDGNDDGVSIIDMGCYEYAAPNYVSIDEPFVEIPDNCQLNNFPNPFNPSTKISFQIIKESDIELSIYNLKGQRIKTIVDGFLQPGEYTKLWNGLNDNDKKVSSGVYFINLDIDNQKRVVKKCLLLK